MKNKLFIAIAGTLVITLLTATAFAGPVIVDKGDLGKYERQGRFLKRIMTPAPRDSSPDTVATNRAEDKVIIDKGDLGKYERRGRFLRRIPNIGPRNWKDRGGAPQQPPIRHDHGVGYRQHKNIKN